MVTLYIIFSTAVLAGLAFWFYNRKKIKSLADQITDKDAVISAFRSYAEDANSEWNGTSQNSNQPETTIKTTVTLQKKSSNKSNGEGKKKTAKIQTQKVPKTVKTQTTKKTKKTN